MAIENFKMGDILVLYTKKISSYSVTANSCQVTPGNQVHTFVSTLNSDPESPSFQVKEFNGSLNANCVKDLDNKDNQQKIRVLQAVPPGQPAYTDAPGTGFFLTQCWSDQGGPSSLDEGWAGSIGTALVNAAQNVGDLNERARKTLIKGSNPRGAGTLIFACKGFAVETMKRLYGINKTMAYSYNLESTIEIGSSITTSAEGERFFQVTYEEKSSESSKTKYDCVKALIIVNDETDLKVKIGNIVSESDLTALNVQFTVASNLSGTSNPWLNAVDDFVNQMENYSAGTGPAPAGFLHQESVPGGGIFKIKITPQTTVSSAVFYVGATFSIGTNANNSFAIKFEGFTVEFSPNRLAYERELIKQLRARYKEAMENYWNSVNDYINTLPDPGGPIVPPSPSPPPQDLLPPPDTIPVPPEGQAPSRENVAEPGLPGANVDGATGSSGGVTIENTGSDARIIDSTNTNLIISD